MQHQVTAFVTGGSGFIGSEVIRQLREKGIKIRALLRKTSSRKFLEGVEFEEVLGDLDDIEALKRGVEGVDYVFHIAGAISARTREDFLRANGMGTGNVARAVAEVNPSLKRFLYVSSLAASGPAETLSPRTETDIERPISAYGESKLDGERQLFKVADGKFSVTVIRPPAVYGPRDRGIFEFFKFIQAGVAPVFPASNPTREKHYSLIYVEDLVRAIVHSGLAEGEGRREVYFVTDGEIHTWNKIMNEIAKAMGKKPWRLRLPGFIVTSLAALYTVLGKITGKQFPLTLDKLNELRPDFWICSNHMARKKLAFTPEYDIRKGLAKTVQWYREEGWLKKETGPRTRA